MDVNAYLDLLADPTPVGCYLQRIWIPGGRSSVGGTSLTGASAMSTPLKMSSLGHGRELPDLPARCSPSASGTSRCVSGVLRRTMQRQP